MWFESKSSKGFGFCILDLVCVDQTDLVVMTLLFQPLVLGFVSLFSWLWKVLRVVLNLI